MALPCLPVVLVTILVVNINGDWIKQYRYTPVGLPLETVCSNTPQTWQELDSLCSKQFPGYRMLQRGYHDRHEEVQAQGLSGLIPLRVKRVSNIVYWINDFGLDNEEVGDEYLMDMQDSRASIHEVYGEDINLVTSNLAKHSRSISPMLRQEALRSLDDNTFEGSETVGALNLANMRWLLVNENYHFASLWRNRRQNGDSETTYAVCAICEMMERRDIRSPVYGAQKDTERSNIYHVSVERLEPEDDQPELWKRTSRLTDENLVMKALANVLQISEDDIELESSPIRNNRRNREIQFLILLSPTNIDALLNKRLVQEKYKVTRIDNLSACAPQNMTEPPIVWPETDAGNVVVRRKQDKLLISRECVQTPNGVEWSKPTIWKKSMDEIECKEGTNSQTRTGPDLSDILHQLASIKVNHHNNTFSDLNQVDGNHGDALLDINDVEKVNNPTKIPVESELKPRTLRETAEFLHSLAAIPVKSRYLDVVAEELNRILQLDQANISTLGNNPTRLAQDLEKIVTNMILESGHDTMCVVKSDVALLVADVGNQNNPLSGVSLFSNAGDKSKMSLKEIHHDDDKNQNLQHSSGVEISTILPYSLISSSKRIAFTIFSDDKLFQGNTSNKFVLQGRVINIAVDGNPHFRLADGEFIEISFKSNNKSLAKQCVFWSFEAKTWSIEGCTLLSLNKRDVCRCNHLTHFALLIAPHKKHHKHGSIAALQTISVVCCCFSLVGLLSITVTLIAFKDWRRELDSLIVMNLSTAMALNIIIYLVTVYLHPKHMRYDCIVLGVLLHYSVLVCFCWMLVIAGLQVLRLFTAKGASGISYLFCKVFIFAWGMPLIPVVTLLARGTDSYRYQSYRQFCYPHGNAFYATVLGPVAVIIVLNILAFILVLCHIYSCCCWKNMYRPKYVIEEVAALRRFKTSIFLFFLFGLPWSFGFFAHNSTAFAYIFCFTATLQGFVLCAFIVILERHSRVLWRKKMFGTYQG